MSKNKPAPKPTAAELDLLRVMWRIGPSSVKQVHEELLRDKPDAAHATVLRLMQIMHGKGLLIRDESQRQHIYAAAHKQSSLQTNLLKDLIHKAFSGSGKELVMAALRGHVSEKEREEIQKFLQENKDE